MSLIAPRCSARKLMTQDKCHVPVTRAAGSLNDSLRGSSERDGPSFGGILHLYFPRFVQFACLMTLLEQFCDGFLFSLAGSLNGPPFHLNASLFLSPSNTA